MKTPDILEYLQAAMTDSGEPLTPRMEQAIQKTRQVYGGDTTYVRSPRKPDTMLSRRAVQHRRAHAR